MSHSNRVLILVVSVVLTLTACQPIQTPTTSATEPQIEVETAAAMPAATPGTEVMTEHRTITSQALAGNLLGDPAERGFSVLLPPPTLPQTNAIRLFTSCTATMAPSMQTLQSFRVCYSLPYSVALSRR